MVFGEIRCTEDSETHIARRNITPYEVEQALYTRPRLAVPGRENTAEVLGHHDRRPTPTHRYHRGR